MTPDLCLANARVISGDEIFRGSIAAAGGKIVAVEHGAGVPRHATDCGGDYVCPGLVELHTDNLERHLLPRPGVRAKDAEAILDHDGELAGTGITTVFDALRVGSLVSEERDSYKVYARRVGTAINSMQEKGFLKANHFIHLRAELCSETLPDELDTFTAEDRIGIVSLMTHAPGHQQFRDPGKFREYLQGKHGMTDAEVQAHFGLLTDLQEKNAGPYARHAAGFCGRVGALLASHDATSEQDAADSARMGSRLAEFPTTLEAAACCARHGIAVMMGAPNLMRGTSHSGNVAAAELVEAGLLDILSSDYVPSALLRGGVLLGIKLGNLARGIAAVTERPAQIAGLRDRGAARRGLRADLVRFRLEDDLPIIRGVWCSGRQVA